jgi:nicotinamide mononucleotide transporter
VVSGYIFLRYTNASYPFLDATLTGFAFIATWLETRKKIENWYIFLVVDGLSIWLFWKKGYILTAILFIIYCIICIYGIIQWHRKIKLSK